MSDFHERLKQLGFASYDDYLAGFHWKAFKAVYKNSGRPQACLVCSSPRYELHHHTYDNLGNESLDDVVPLCREHHEAVHAALDQNGWGVGGTFGVLRALNPGLSRKKPRPRKKKNAPKRTLPPALLKADDAVFRRRAEEARLRGERVRQQAILHHRAVAAQARELLRNGLPLPGVLCKPRKQKTKVKAPPSVPKRHRRPWER